MTAAADMVEGYLDGLRDARLDPPEPGNRGACYWHGWLNGRDDRIGAPRAPASTLRVLASAAIALDLLAGIHA